MKKIFLEPDMVKIELCLRENIASSTVSYIKFLNVDFLTCTVQHTGKLITQGVTQEDLLACTVYQITKDFGTAIPVEEVLPYIRF